MNESERRDKRTRQEGEKVRQLDAQKRLDEQFERLNQEFNPPYPLSKDPNARDDSPTNVSDDDSSVDSGDDDGSFSAPEGAPEQPGNEETPASTLPSGSQPINVQPPSPAPAGPNRRSKRLKKPTPPRRSERLRRGRNANNVKVRKGSYEVCGKRLDSHPDFNRCYTNLVTDRMRDDTYHKDHHEKFACTLGTKQAPRK